MVAKLLKEVIRYFPDRETSYPIGTVFLKNKTTNNNQCVVKKLTGKRRTWNFLNLKLPLMATVNLLNSPRQNPSFFFELLLE